MIWHVMIMDVTLDSTMTLDGQIAATCRSSYGILGGPILYVNTSPMMRKNTDTICGDITFRLLQHHL